MKEGVIWVGGGGPIDYEEEVILVGGVGEPTDYEEEVIWVRGEGEGSFSKGLCNMRRV